jgi:plastocyanin
MKLNLRHARWVSWGAAAVLLASAPAAWGLANLAISQHNLRFSQAQISIHEGDTVTFSNDDVVTHNISVRDGDQGDTEDLGLQTPKVSVSHRFDQKGLYSVVCSIHPKMRLTVAVN